MPVDEITVEEAPEEESADGTAEAEAPVPTAEGTAEAPVPAAEGTVDAPDGNGPEASDAEEDPADEDDFLWKGSVSYFASESTGIREDTAETTVAADDTAAPEGPAEGTTLEFEPEQVTKVSARRINERKPYHERYYLLFGGQTVPDAIKPRETLDFLRARGYGNNELTQARNGVDVAKRLEETFVPGQKTKHYCDFCGTEILGTEYEVLNDGRERCMVCSRTAVKTEEEFVDLYQEVLANLQAFYGIKINIPIQVRMVNAKKLHKALGKTFVPTGNTDGRILGAAIKSNKGYQLLVENGSPRMATMMTMAHELTHMWQYITWDRKAIRSMYGKQELEIYEGMAKWSEIQYAYLLNETASAKREEIITRKRNDEYGRGFLRYVYQYPLSSDTPLKGDTPFAHPEQPLS